MTLRVAEGDEKYKRRVFFDGALAMTPPTVRAFPEESGQIGNLPHRAP